MLATEIEHVTRRLAQARGRLHELTVVRPQMIAGLNRRLGEMELNHPHILASLDKAVRLKLSAQMQQDEKSPQEGWLP